MTTDPVALAHAHVRDFLSPATSATELGPRTGSRSSRSEIPTQVRECSEKRDGFGGSAMTDEERAALLERLRAIGFRGRGTRRPDGAHIARGQL
jgi:hypothetical protein